ncbi:MAG: thiamine diphosphokinase [Sphaerochaeta sp.]|nr:thiamine diphosphokinase [Sphaerochaeta sp.]
MSKAIIFTGGAFPKSLPKDLYEKGDYLIAADSGFDIAKKLGFTVDFAIGDFDSTKCFKEIQLTNFEKHAEDKDESDTYLAIKKGLSVVNNGYVLVGGGGYRIDHLMATYSLFSLFGPPRSWYTAYETNILISSYHRFSDCKIGDTISLYPATLSGKAKVTAKQLTWPLIDYDLQFSTISLSNRVNDRLLDIFVKGESIFASFPVARTIAKVLP